MPTCPKCGFENAQTDICSNCSADLRPAGTDDASNPALAIERARRDVIVAAIAWRCVPDRRDQEGIDAVLADAIDRLLAIAPE